MVTTSDTFGQAASSLNPRELAALEEVVDSIYISLAPEAVIRKVSQQDDKAMTAGVVRGDLGSTVYFVIGTEDDALLRLDLARVKAIMER